MRSNQVNIGADRVNGMRRGGVRIAAAIVAVFLMPLIAGDTAVLIGQGSSTLSATPSSLRFAATKATAAGDLGAQTPAQEVTLTFDSGAPAWTATTTAPWLQITNGSGTGNGRFKVAVVNPSNTIGGSTSLSANVTVTASGVANSPLSVPVSLSVYMRGTTTTTGPFGAVDTPTGGATVVGAIPVTGWALDDIGVNHVSIWRNCVEAIDRARGACIHGPLGGPPDYVFLGIAIFLLGARPDVEAAFPTPPQPYRAGWGFMLLTNALPHQIRGTPEGGQGSYTLSAFAIDEESGCSVPPCQSGSATLLGTKVITVNNDAATVPFGTIDTPGQGATIPEASAPYNDANAYPSFGWAMTQAGKCIDTTSTSVYKVFIDGVQRPLTPGVNWFAGLNRSDLAAAFPGLCNSNNALAAYYINASALGLSTGLHTVSWDVTDSASQTVFGLGTRFFNVVASGADALAQTRVPLTASAEATTARRTVTARIGGADAPAADTVVQDTAGYRFIRLPLGQRLHVDLGAPVEAGYQVVAREVRALPVGSTLDAPAGTFAWEPPAGFFGPFALVFVAAAEQGVNAIRS